MLKGNFHNFREVWNWSVKFFWRRQSVYAFLLMVVLAGLVWQLSIIPEKAALEEVFYANDVSSVSSIVENPLYLPHKIASYTASYTSDSIRVIRGISVLTLGIAVVALYRILRRWHSEKVAFLASAMFATNATVLAVGRLAAPEILLMSWSLIIAAMLWLQHGNSRHFAPLWLFIVSSFLLYVPGSFYFFLLITLLYSNKIKETILSVKRSTVFIGALLFLLLITPLLFAVTENVEVLRQWLLIPSEIIWSDVPMNIVKVFSAFMYEAPFGAIVNVGDLPIFNIASGGLFVIGLYSFRKHMKLERTRIMLLTFLIAIILGAYGQIFTAVLILLPYSYSIIAAGISFLLDQWYSVFPVNKIVRSFGLLFVTLVVTLSVFYNVYRFFVVWPQAPETRAVYDQPRLIK